MPKTRYPTKVHAVTLDENATSKRLDKLRVDKFCPSAGTQTIAMRKDGSFTVAEGGCHKLLAWQRWNDPCTR